ncbi:choloylglycine hydrolase family protein [Oenococcus kitaharae]|uniref:Penicillin acylase n=1 Tax=Oenococcus kitaharae DSM 17330 TaxID=1045004 RepID=G9WFG4_9LACO|nr:choloylglycine hydrolase family protein [Oenococcus kitaharae]EHN59121.1 penicillin acylase [Oenococcus kitaharae DSM 17330]OEY81995.1 penicillin acylase [Oenococcus kitaharae]OEY82366.1 penicillin acylase [Oenococcus kitaharae]OEY82772.1 penicillin acylase [Oenococcus kitaharae]
MCTSIFQTAENGQHLFSRTMDWEGLYAFPTFLSRNYQWRSAFDGKTYNSRYALIGSGHAVADRADISDGVNERGLSVQKLTFSAGKDHFAQSRKADRTQIAPFEFPLWAMTQFDSVASLLAALPTLEIMNDQEAVREYGEADLHFAAADPTGRFVIIEPLSMPMRVIENPLGVVTNAGDFQKEAAKLADYMTLLPEYAAGRLPYNLQHVSTGDFSGKKQFPGGYTPSARFIRAAYLKERMTAAADEQHQLVAAWHILNAVTVPKMPARSQTYTVYRSAVALESKTLYYESYDSQQIYKIVLDDHLAAQTKAISFEKQIRDFHVQSLD